MSKKNKILRILFGVGCFLIVGIAVGAGFVASGYFSNRDIICDGVTISGLPVGGLKKEEAAKKLNSYKNKLENRQVTVIVDGGQAIAKASELGFSCDEKDTIDKAFAVGKTGNIFSRGNVRKEAKEGKYHFNMKYTVDETSLDRFIEEQCTPFNVKVKNSKLKLVNGAFQATKARNGKEVQVEETKSVLKDALTKNLSDNELEVTAVVKTTKPKYTKKMVSQCKSLIGSYSTSYGTSTPPRANNVKVAAGYINGTVIYPGKTFSVIKTIKDRTEANGYQAAPEYSSGSVVSGVGGGVCQVSTTLYNAVLNAELEVVERSPHSMVVKYVDVSRDAAISGDYKDFKFKNNTDAPVYIAAVADGSTLAFRIYGKETREKGRTIKFESEVLKEIQPGDPIETVDETKPASYRVETQSPHVGYQAKLWKIIYENGVQKDKVLVNTSSYAAEPAHITVGKKEATPSPSPEASVEPSEKPDSKQTAEPKHTEKPKKTTKPAVTEKPAKETEKKSQAKN